MQTKLVGKPEEKKIELILGLMEQLDVSVSDLRKQGGMFLPISIFNKRLSSLETIVKYMKDNLKMHFNEIAKALNRKPSTIRTTYTNANKKFSWKLDVSDTTVVIPVDIFKDRSRSVLKSIVVYMKDELKLSFKKIAELLKRNYKTIWTVYNK